MNPSELTHFIREHFGIRIDASSAEYLHQKLNEQPNIAVPVMGGDARTGVAVRKFVSLDPSKMKSQ